MIPDKILFEPLKETCAETLSAKGANDTKKPGNSTPG